ncbi:DUF3618 domain-containing protein [Pseudonocardia asaccharolytica]|uniref:Cell division protein FtsB n=1 Tax=Pseudonocardia asaccharolytica DSM 44247 = NBRC 16224 TaxID=1123024 RepID=A0A511D6W5_9PSEU|nr:DUF3618 domain-containing protein [Pseudonocardia asaccharolytica]GEL18698.1 hypothetical protein PA7_25350 [Pseudonocardia asaccharolytica DSM 44247 = NBRC 16224]
MARDPETIQREIEKTRDALAESLNELADRAHPRKFVDSGKQQLQARMADPRIKYALYGVGALLALAVLRKIFR